MFADGAVWVESDEWSVTRIDPANDAKSVPVKFHYLRCCLAVGGGFVWLVTRQDQTVWRFEPGGGLDGPLGSVKLRGDVRSLAYGDGALWATTGAAGTVIRSIPPPTPRIRSGSGMRRTASLRRTAEWPSECPRVRPTRRPA